MGAILTDLGRAIVTGRMLGLGTEPRNIGWGTGEGTPDKADAALFSEASEARVAGSSSRASIDATNDTYRVIGTLECSGAAKRITNVGIFDDAGNLYIKSAFPGVPLEVGDKIQFTFNHQFAQEAD